MASRYQPPSKAPQTAWARHIDRFMREKGLSQTQAFEMAQGPLGLKPKSRASFLPYLEKREPTEYEAQALASVFGWPAPEDEPAQTVEDQSVAAAIREQTAAIRANTDAVRQLLEALTARVMTPELAQAYRELGAAGLPTHPGRTGSQPQASRQETSTGR